MIIPPVLTTLVASCHPFINSKRDDANSPFLIHRNALFKRQFKCLTALIAFLCCTCSIYAQFDPTPRVIINEINYRTDISGNFTEYIELHNTTSITQDISDWILEDAVEYRFPAGTSIQPNGYLIVAQNVDDFLAHIPFSGVATNRVVGPWDGALRNSGEDIVLRDDEFLRIDNVDYDNWNEWPSTGHLEDENLSLQKVHTDLPGRHAGSWDAATHTPAAPNIEVEILNPDQRPIIQEVRRSPDSPLSHEDIRVRVELDRDNLSTINSLVVNLEYKKLSPGNFEAKSSPLYNQNWITVQMRDDGNGPDSTANNGVFTALIPASTHNHRDLVRYRINISTNNSFDETYPDQNYDECNYAYYVYDGYPEHEGFEKIIEIEALQTTNPIQEFTVFTRGRDAALYIGDEEGDHEDEDGDNMYGQQYQGNEFLGTGAVIYEGRVYDHINFRPRGSGSRLGRVKPGIRFRMNREHSFETQNDCGQTYDEDRGRMVLSGGWVHDQGGHGLTESLIYKVLELTGGIERNVNYTQLRVVDDALETGNKGDFWGLYLILEDYNGDLIDERNQLEEGNFWNTSVDPLVEGGLPRQRDLDYQGHFPDSETILPWAEPELHNSGNGFKDMDNELDLDMMFADRIANVIYGQHGSNYIGKHSYREYYNSVTNKYYAWWADMDNSFGSLQNDPNNNNRRIEDNWVFTRAQTDPDVHLDNDIFVTETYKIQYQNALRSVYDLLLNDEQINFLIDEETKLVHTDGNSDDWMEVDQDRWGHVYDATNGLRPNTADAHVEWYRNWFIERRGYLANDNNQHPNTNTIETDHIIDMRIPNTPTISLAANGSFAIDELRFEGSVFSDPQGSNTIMAREWRIAEWSDDDFNPFYSSRCTPHYEIETVWASGERPYNNSNRTFNYDEAVSELEPERTYKVRLRYKDTTGRWSHWSEAITFIAEEVNTPTANNIIISEIHYNPTTSCAEFVEIYNNSNSPINLENYRFSDGIDFTFSDDIIGPGEYKLVVRDEDCYDATIGLNLNDIIGEYDGRLDNGGEEIKLESPNGTRLDSVNYDDKLPWDPIADEGLHSLALIDLQSDNNLARNWTTQCDEITPGEPNDFTHAFVGTPCDNGNPCTPISINSACDCIAVENIALNGTPSMSSQVNAILNASNLNDNEISNVNSELAHTSEQTPTEWVEIDLGSPMLVSAVVLHNRTNCCANLINNAYVMISNSPFPDDTDLMQALDNADDIAQLGDESAMEIIGVEFNQTARYVRVQKSGDNQGGDAINLKELQIFTPFTESDSDNDGICDALDSCPNFDNNLIGQPCDDGIFCFEGSTYDANCGCSGGSFADDDGDETCNAADKCPGGNDDIDLDNNGIPDACDCTQHITTTEQDISQSEIANISIASDGTVEDGEMISFRAGQEILLLGGFEVEEGAIFHAYIGPCN